jgi:hypothetical protein
LHGAAADVLDAATVGELYGIELRELRWEDGRTFVPV